MADRLRFKSQMDTARSFTLRHDESQIKERGESERVNSERKISNTDVIGVSQTFFEVFYFQDNKM